MATGTSLLLRQISDDFFGCKLCRQPYRRPKVLSCLHPFCQKCLELLYQQQEKPQQLECPTCRTTTELPGSGIPALKDFAESLKDAVKLHKTVQETAGDGMVCGFCESGGEAKSYCLVCGVLLCDDCISAHCRIKPLKWHKLFGMEEVLQGTGLKSTKPRAQTCRLHEDESLKFYCETRGEAMCGNCVTAGHKDHSYVRLDKASVGIKKGLVAALGDAYKRLAELKDCQQDILSKKSLLKDTVAEVKDSINEAAEQTRKRLLDQVNAEQQYLLRQVQDIERKTEKDLCSVEDAIETAILALTGTTDYSRSIIANGTDLEITNVKTDVQARLRSLLQLSPSEMRTPVGEPWVQFVPNGATIDNHVTMIGQVIGGAHLASQDMQRMAAMRMPAPQHNQMFQGSSYFVPSMQPRYFPSQMVQVRASPRWAQSNPMRPGTQVFPIIPEAASPFPTATALRAAAAPVRHVVAPQSMAPTTQPPAKQMASKDVAPTRQPHVTYAAVTSGQPRPGDRHTPTTPPQTVHIHGLEPLTASMLAAAPPKEQKQMLGERLFPLIQDRHPDLAGKITGMLLEIDNAELLHMLESRVSLEAKVEEAVAVLQAHRAKEQAVRAGDQE